MDDTETLQLIKETGAKVDWNALLTRIVNSNYRCDENGKALKYIIRVCNDEVWADAPGLRERRMFFLLRYLVLGHWHEGVIKEVLAIGADPNFKPIDECGKLVSTPLFDAFKYMIMQIKDDVDQIAALRRIRIERDDKTVRQHVEKHGQIVRHLLEAGTKIDIDTRALVKSRPDMQIILDGFIRRASWDAILAELDGDDNDNEFWIVIEESMRDIDLSG
jgi:hypothetical protein